MTQAIRKRWRDFAAILAIVLVAVVVGGFILGKQRLTGPSWVPYFGKDFYTLNGEFTTAQAVTPGQGQSVNIAGVNVGEISNVKLVDGRALVTMKIEQKYARVYRDASLLLRPKTPLKDMLVELTPGSPSAGRLPSGGTIPVSNTLPDVNLDEVWAALDTDTRDSLNLLLNGGGEGLEGQGRTLSNVLRRFEPTSRDLAKITSLLEKRRKNLARAVHNFQELSTELAGKDVQIGRFVDSSNAVFQSFASQEASIRESLQLLPDTLQVTQSTLGKVNTLASTAGPTLQALLPAARALGPTLQQSRSFFQDTTPVVRNELRPFSKAVLPVVFDLRPAVGNLEKVVPELVKSFEVVNILLNELSYDPKGQEEGYLFFVPWLNHIGATVFSDQDALGPIRRGLVFVSCSGLQVLNTIGTQDARLGALSDLLDAPTSEEVCPG